MRKRVNVLILVAGTIFWQHCQPAQLPKSESEQTDFQKAIHDNDKKQLQEDREKLMADQSKQVKTAEQIQKDKKRLKLDRKMKRMDKKKLAEE